MRIIKEFWEQCHHDQNVSHLSGVKYDEVIKSLHIEDYIYPKTKILEIGVGLGNMVKSLNNIGAEVSAIDISDIAINRVKKYCKYAYTIDNIEQIPSDYFDLITCLNVIQHIPTHLLKKELSHFLRALKTSGIFAMQFVSSKHGEDLGANAKLLGIKAGTLCRTPQFMGKLIVSLGGTYTIVYERNDLNIGKVNGNHVFHIKRCHEES